MILLLLQSFTDNTVLDVNKMPNLVYHSIFYISIIPLRILSRVYINNGFRDLGGRGLRLLTLSGLGGQNGHKKLSRKFISWENKGASFSGHTLNQKKNWLSRTGRGGGGVCMRNGKFHNFFSDFKRTLP